MSAKRMAGSSVAGSFTVTSIAPGCDTHPNAPRECLGPSVREMRVARGSPHDREIVRLAAPPRGARAAEPLYLLADTAIVGHLGTRPLAGLAVAGSVLTAAFTVFNFLAY